MSEFQVIPVINYCKVAGCRFPQFHVTLGHKCGKCKSFGHGMIECTNQLNKAQLARYHGDMLPDEFQCKFGSCRYKQYHTSEGHYCSKCQERLHGASTCPYNLKLEQKSILDIKCPVCKQVNKVDKNQQKIFGLTDTCVICLGSTVEVFFPNCGHVCLCTSCFKKLTNQDKVDVFDEIRDENILSQQSYQLDMIKSFLPDYPSYITVYEGMGCCSIIRRLNSNAPLEGLFNHSDDGFNPVKINKLRDFVDGYCLIQLKNQSFLIHDWKGTQEFDV